MKKLNSVFLTILMLILIIPVVFIFQSCLKSESGVANGEKIGFDTISNGQYSKQIEKKYFVISDKAGMDQLVELIKGTGNAEISISDINFPEEMVVGVFIGEKPSGGYDVEVTGVLNQKEYIEFLIKTVEPGPDDIVTEAITSPYHIIKLKSSDKEFLFNIVE